MNRHFPFVQFELTHSIGPPAGRYVVSPPDTAEANGHAPTVVVEEEEEETGGRIDPIDLGIGMADVLLVQVIGAPAPKAKMFRRGLAPAVEAEEPRELSITVVTAILATQPLASDRTAKEWLRTVRSRPEAQEEFVLEGLSMVNLAIVAYRACAADPYVVELTRNDPRTTRIGYGLAEQVVLGKWTSAIGVPPPPPPRVDRTIRLMPTQGMAAVLAGQAHVLESEELVLRALLDIQQERFRAAAAGLHAAVELLLGEVAGEVLRGEVQQRMEVVVGERERLERLAAAARRGPLGPADVDALRAIAETVGSAIDQRRYAPMGF